MKKITFKKMLLLFSFLCSGNILMAQVQTAGSYVPLGDTLLSYVTTDADNGDGANDGAILVDIKLQMRMNLFKIYQKNTIK